MLQCRRVRHLVLRGLRNNILRHQIVVVGGTPAHLIRRNVLDDGRHDVLYASIHLTTTLALRVLSVRRQDVRLNARRLREIGAIQLRLRLRVVCLVIRDLEQSASGSALEVRPLSICSCDNVATWIHGLAH